MKPKKYFFRNDAGETVYRGDSLQEVMTFAGKPFLDLKWKVSIQAGRTRERPPEFVCNIDINTDEADVFAVIDSMIKSVCFFSERQAILTGWKTFDGRDIDIYWLDLFEAIGGQIKED